MQPPSDHQVQHQPEVALDADCNSLAGAPEPLHTLAERVFERWVNGAQKERTYDPHRFQLLPENPFFKRLNVDGDVGKFRQTAPISSTPVGRRAAAPSAPRAGSPPQPPLTRPRPTRQSEPSKTRRTSPPPGRRP